MASSAIKTEEEKKEFFDSPKELEKKIQTEYKVDDLKDELWDMAKPASPHCITL